MKAITNRQIRALIPPRKSDSHKGSYGHSLLVAGNTGSMGAAVIAARACLRTGTGLLTVHVPENERTILQVAIPEAMLSLRGTRASFKPYSAIGVGPGLGKGRPEQALLKRILQQATCPLVLDADALNLLAANSGLWSMIPPSTILTPHPKEFDRLFGPQANHEDRIRCAIAKAAERNIVLVLKGHRTVITSGSRSFYNTTGNAGLAKGGSGDALTGMITAFLAQGREPLDAALAAVYLHGLAAELSLEEQSMESMLISDVIDHIGKAFARCRG